MKIAHSVLSESQRRVIEHPVERPGVVDAGAGTGKTFTIVERVAALAERGVCPAKNVLLLTFGRKAAAELRARIKRRLGEDAPNCLTFHAFAWSILQAHAYDIGISPETTVIEDADARVEFRKAFDEFVNDAHAGSSGFPLRAYNCDEIRTALFALDQRIKQEGLTIDAFRTRALAAADEFARVPYRELLEPYNRAVKGQTHKTLLRVTDDELAQEVAWEKQRIEACAEVLSRFAARLAARQSLTYADILARAERALREHGGLQREVQAKYCCCIVDEYQDTDLAQHRLLEALFGRGLARVMVVGDRLQSIFSFRGAHPENVLLFEQAPESAVYTLVENRRSRQKILDFAHVSVVRAHADAKHLRGERRLTGEQIVHISSVWTTPDGHHPLADEGRELEAAAVARRIRQLLASGVQVEVGRSEAIAPRHIAILSRTKKNVRPVTLALLDSGIPFKLVGGVGFYDAPEIRDTLAWLRLLANPFDSFAVARALQSTAIAAPDAALARLAFEADRDETAFARNVLVEELPRGDELSDRAREAAEKLRRLLDALAPHSALPLGSSLRAVIDTTGIERFYQESSDARAAQALANMTKLEALARSFAESTPGAQPADFVNFIGELENVDFDEREADVSSSDAVTISTIHAAKGLEWPFVFILSVWPPRHAESRLILASTGALLYSENPDGSPSFHYLSVKREADSSGLVAREDSEDPEERRLFYVAITRARDRVFISGVRGKRSKEQSNGAPHKFLREGYEWLRTQGWAADEAVAGNGSTSKRVVFGQVNPASLSGRTISSATIRTQVQAAEDVRALPLSYSLIARFERCRRQATYKCMFRLPEVVDRHGLRRAETQAEGFGETDEPPTPDSLLNAGKYGLVVHKALEEWAVDRRLGSASRTAREYLAAAVRSVEASPSKQQRDDAECVLEQVMRELGSWRPIEVEAPFTLDFGDEAKPLVVTGYLDLLARDAQGRPCLIDYKTGDPSADHALQLALYREAAREVYGLDNALCFIGKIDGKNFALQAVEPASADELRRRIVAVSAGLLARDVVATPGPWCWTCGYRGAPCRDYLRTT